MCLPSVLAASQNLSESLLQRKKKVHKFWQITKSRVLIECQYVVIACQFCNLIGLQIQQWVRNAIRFALGSDFKCGERSGSETTDLPSGRGSKMLLGEPIKNQRIQEPSDLVCCISFYDFFSFLVQ